jgi:superkiller protein 3
VWRWTALLAALSTAAGPQDDGVIRRLQKAVAESPGSAAAHEALGRAYVETGSIAWIAEAQAEFRQALELDPARIWPRFYLARIYLDLGRLERARDELEAALRVKADVPHLLSLLGEVHRKLGDPDRSLELNRRVLELDPSMTPAHYYRALAWLDRKNDDEAARELEKALQSKYVIPEMYLTLGQIRLRQNQPQAALDLYRKAVDLDPRRPEGRLRLAEAYRLQKDYPRALAELKLASPDQGRFLSTEYYQRLQADVWFETGRVYQDLGKAAEARAAWNRALQVDPRHEEARRALAGLP